MEQEKDFCCAPANNSQNKALLSGILYGLVPHFFCIVFIVFSVVGAVTATTFLKKFLMVPYFFHFLVLASLLMAAISSVIYLKKNNCLCVSGIKRKWKYIAILCSVMIFTNLMMFLVIFPVLANINSSKEAGQGNYLASLSIAVQIPCSGHAPLIVDELKRSNGVGSVAFKLPNVFEVRYDPQKITQEKIISLEIFKTYKATLN